MDAEQFSLFLSNATSIVISYYAAACFCDERRRRMTEKFNMRLITEQQPAYK